MSFIGLHVGLLNIKDVIFGIGAMIVGTIIVGAMIVGAISVGAMSVGAVVVEAMIVGTMIVGAMRRPRQTSLNLPLQLKPMYTIFNVAPLTELIHFL